jgi:hypothetical protein
MENPWWHNKRCAESPAPKKECKCKQCNQSLHGILATPRYEAIPREREIPDFPRRRPRKKKTKSIAAVAAVVTVTGTFAGLTATGTFSSPSDGSGGLSVQATFDLNKAVSALGGLGFGGKVVAGVGVPYGNDPTNCAESATGQVKVFLTHYPCRQYAADTWSITRQDSSTYVVFAWTEMPITPLADRYKALVDKFGSGNPPGVSPFFNGLCYASGQQGATVWTVEVHPTGNPDVDPKILQAAAPQELPMAYLTKHCVT